MAIDTATARRAVSGVTFPLTVSVTPDADEGETWRRSVGWGYLLSTVVLAPAARHTLGPDVVARYLGPDADTRYLGPDPTTRYLGPD